MSQQTGILGFRVVRLRLDLAVKQPAEVSIVIYTGLTVVLTVRFRFQVSVRLGGNHD